MVVECAHPEVVPSENWLDLQSQHSQSGGICPQASQRDSSPYAMSNGFSCLCCFLCISSDSNSSASRRSSRLSPKSIIILLTSRKLAAYQKPHQRNSLGG